MKIIDIYRKLSIVLPKFSENVEVEAKRLQRPNINHLYRLVTCTQVKSHHKDNGQGHAIIFKWNPPIFMAEM